MGAKIDARQVERVFVGRAGEVKALGPLDLTIDEGEFVCVVGPSGCGKTTLLHIIAGLTTPSAGHIDLAVRGNVKSPTAVVFQEYAIYPWKSVLANVRFGLDLAGVKRKDANRRARAWLDRVGLTDFANAYPAALSGGMRQRVSIARALAVEPEILLMDEPFAALDAQLRLVLQDELLRLWESDRRTVVFVTHSIDEALFLGDRVVVMSARPGQIVADVEVGFDRPRTSHLRRDAAFAAMQDDIWEQLRVEVDGSLAQTGGGS